MEEKEEKVEKEKEKEDNQNKANNDNDNKNEKEDSNKEENKEDKDNKEEEGEEDKTVKIHYKNDEEDYKTSFCHIIFHNGIDIDITRKKVFECYEQSSNRKYLFFKKTTKIKTLLFIEEHYLYLLKDIIIDKTNDKLRRINNKFDLNKLFDYKIKKKDNDLLFTLDFLLDDNLFERNEKNLLFEEKEGENFENYLIDTLEKIDSVFLDEIFGDDEEEEEEEEKEGKEGGENKEDNKNDKEDDKKEEKKENKELKKMFKRIEFDEGKDSFNSNMKSSSRFVLKKFNQ